MTVKPDMDLAENRVKYAAAGLLTGAIAISFAPILVRFSTLEPVVSAMYRLGLALPFFMILPFFGASKRTDSKALRPKLTMSDAILVFLCGAMLAADLALWHISITWTSVANATLFNNCAPVVLLALGWAFFNERITREVVTALVVAVAGMALLMGENFALSPDQFVGDMVAVSTAFFYALYLFMVKSLRAKYNTWVIMFGTTLASSLCLLTVSVAQDWPLVPPDLNGWMIVIALALICHVVGQSLIANSLAYLPVAISSFGLLLQPVSAAILAWLLFNEALSLVQILGGFLVLGGIVLSNRARRSLEEASND